MKSNSAGNLTKSLTKFSANKVTVCIPTYWTGASGFPAKDSLTNIYDHPTPVTDQGTLERTLISFSTINQEFDVVIIGMMTEPQLRREFQAKLKKMLTQFSNLNIYWFSYDELDSFHKRLESEDAFGQKKFLSLEGYSNIRNLCLILPHILKSDLALMIDDDEVVTDKDFIQKARDFMGDVIDEERVLAKSGIYIKSAEAAEKTKYPWWEWYWPKSKSMEAVFNEAKEGQRISEARIALGGAMVVHKDVFTKVSFDPWALRGEDIDYLINCKLHGINFFLDNELKFLHLPPGHASPILVMRQDMYRFMYEKEKLDYAFNHTSLKHFPIEDLDPYPGMFLRKDVGRRALSLALFSSLKGIRGGNAIGQLRLLKTAMMDANGYAKRNKNRWFGFQRLWPNFMDSIAEINPTDVLTKI